MKYIRASLTVCLILTLAGCGSKEQDVLTRSLDYDEMEVFEVVDFEVPGSTSFSLSIDAVPEGGDKWAPYIYYALRQDDVGNSFRLFLVKNEAYDDLIAGVEYYKNGKNIFRNVLITGVPLEAKVDFSLSWEEDGVFTYSVMGGEEKEFESGFNDFNAIIHMSNATASFY